MAVVSPCFRDARRLFVGPATSTIPRRHVFSRARAPIQQPQHSEKTSGTQSLDQSATAAWQQPGNVASAVVHRAGLFAVGALVAVLILGVFKRTMRALGLDRRLTLKGAHQVDGRSNPLRAIMHTIFPGKADSHELKVWPGPVPRNHELTPPIDQGTVDKQLQETTDGTSVSHEGTAEGGHMAEMSSLVKQASEKVVALEQLVSVLKTQVKIAERRAGVAEEQAASMANQLSKQEASEAKVQKLTQQLSVADANLREKAEALAAANNEIWNLQRARQLLLAEEKQNAEKLQQAAAAQDSSNDSLRAAVKASREQLALSEASMATARAREQSLLGDVDSAREAQRAAEGLVLQAAEERMELEAALSEAQGKASALHSSLQTARADLSAAEAQRDTYAAEVEALKADVSAAADRIEAGDASIAALEGEVQAVQELLQAERDAVGRLEQRAAGSRDLAEQLQQLRSGMAEVQAAREAAVREAAAATAQLNQVQQDVAEAVTAIADRAATGTFEEPAAPPLPAAICSLPVSELQARAQQQRDVQEGFAAQARELEARLPPESQRRLEAVQSQMALQPAEEEWEELQTAAEAILQEQLSEQEVLAHRELEQGMQQCRQNVTALESAVQLPLQERVAGVLSQYVAQSKRAMLEDVAAAEAEGRARASAVKAEALASAQAQRVELEAWKQEQEAGITAAAKAQQLQLSAIQEQRRELQEQAAELQAQREQLQTQAATAKEADARAAAVQGQQEQLAVQRAEVEAGQAKAEAAAAEAAADAARAAEERARAEAAQVAAQARLQDVAAREAEAAGKEQRAAAALGSVNKQLDDVKALAERQIRQGRDAAAAEVDRLKQELQRVQTGQEEEAAAAQAALRERVAGLERELFTLKDRYSRQFIDYKQRLDESEGRVRRLRRALTDRDSGDGESDAPAASAEAAPAAAPHGASSVEDVSTWASQLVTKLSEEADTGAAAGDAMAAVGTAAPEAPASDTWPRGAAAATAAVAEPEARPDTLRLHASGHCIPHPAKVERGGEDAHFILGSYAIGVADGVGGWSKDGVDPGEYSRELMRQTAQALRRDSARSMSCVEALGVAHDSVAVPGTSTAIVARMLDHETLEVANLGDSGLRVVRDGEIVFATETLQHGFNMPFQLGCRDIIPHTDVPGSALRTVLQVQAGDVVIMASDGFFDNVWDKDLARLVKNSCLFDGYEEENCVETMAQRLAEVAAENSKDSECRTPWSVASAQHKDVGLLMKLFPKGGKVDDISVIVAQIEGDGDS